MGGHHYHGSTSPWETIITMGALSPWDAIVTMGGHHYHGYTSPWEAMVKCTLLHHGEPSSTPPILKHSEVCLHSALAS